MPTTRTAAVAGIALIALAATAAPALAHVTIPDAGEKGGFSIVTFSVPNERPDAGTTTVEVKLPEDNPLPFVSVQPKPGWTAATTMRTLDQPVDAFGEQVTEVVDTVTWTGGTIEPGQFDTFSLSVGPLPDDVDGLAFPTIQTYSSGEEVAWIEETPEGGEEPEHPAPLLRLVDPAGGSHDEGEATTPTVTADDESEDETDGMAVAALVVAIVAALLGGAALVTGRRRSA